MVVIGQGAPGTARRAPAGKQVNALSNNLALPILRPGPSILKPIPDIDMVKGSSLRVSVANLSEGGLDLKLSLAEDWFGQWQKEDSRLEFGGPGAITARIHLAKHGRDILLRGRLEGALPLTCSRCLETFAFAMAADFDLLLAPGPQSLGGGQEELSADDLDLDFYGGDEVNLEDFLREQILLGLPLKPLCTETCRGLCTQCGVDLNRQTCTCQEHKGESAFAALATMKE